MKSRNLLVIAPLLLAGCGLSYDYQAKSLANASDAQLCYAATDPRTGGFAVRARAAGDIVAGRGVECDYATEALLHAGQAQAQQEAIRNSLDMMRVGHEMMRPTYPAAAVCQPLGDAWECWK